MSQQTVDRLTAAISRRNDLQAQRRALDEQVEQVSSDIGTIVYEADITGLDDAILALLWAETWGIRSVSDELAFRAPHTRGFNRVSNGGGKYDAFSPRFEERDIVKDPRSVAEAVVDCKRRFGHPDKTMVVNLGLLPGEGPQTDKSIYLRSADTTPETVEAILLASLPQRA